MALIPKRGKKPQSYENVRSYNRFVDSNSNTNDALNVLNAYDTSVYKGIYQQSGFDLVAGDNAGQISDSVTIPVNAIITNISFSVLVGGGISAAPSNQLFFTSLVFDIRNGGNIKYFNATALDHIGGFSTGNTAITVNQGDQVVVTWSYTGSNTLAVNCPLEYTLYVSYIEI